MAPYESIALDDDESIGARGRKQETLPGKVAQASDDLLYWVYDGLKWTKRKLYSGGSYASKNLTKGKADRRAAYSEAKKSVSGALCGGHCERQLWRWAIARCLCIPICLFFFFTPLIFTARFVDEAFPTIGGGPASARELGFLDMPFVHLYFGLPDTWSPAPSPPPPSQPPT